MAKSQYNGDSPFPSAFSEHSGMSGRSETFPGKLVPIPDTPAIETSSLPAPYILDGGAAMYIGESMDCSRRLRDHGAADATPRQSGAFPTTSSID